MSRARPLRWLAARLAVQCAFRGEWFKADRAWRGGRACPGLDPGQPEV